MNRARKLQWYLFCLLIILLSTQLGRHFWPSWAFVKGVRVDYFSPTLYLTDILVVGLFVLELCALLRRRPKFFIFHFSFFIYFLIGLLVYLNITSSLSLAVSVYKWIKVAEFGFLGWWICRNYKFSILNFKSSTNIKFSSLLLIPVFYESVLAVWQFWAQSSIGGIWYWLGERTFNSATLGIANAYINGSLVLRPYGTFPHPNVLGGFLAVFLPLILALQLRSLQLRSGQARQARFLQNYRKINAGGKEYRVIKLLVIGAVGVGYVALFLSMGRSAIVVGLVATVVVLFQFFKSWRQRFTLVLLVLFVIWVSWARFSSLGIETESITAREQLNSRAIGQWKHSPIFGTGLGTSPVYSQILNTKYKILNYALVYQPVHNIYLLLLSETGVLGLGIFGVLGLWAIKRVIGENRLLLLPLLSILALGLVDHYFLTVQQGQLIVAIILGLSLGKAKVSEVTTGLVDLKTVEDWAKAT